MLLNYLEPSFSLGPLTIHLYGLMLAIAMLAGLSLAMRRAARKNIDQDFIWEMTIYCIVGAVIGARLFSVALHFERFVADPLYLFKVHEGGMAYYGALAGGALAGYLYLRLRQRRAKRVGFWTVADLFAPSLALGEAITRLGCDVIGLTSPAAPWPRIVNGVPHHNIPLYMVVGSLLLFILLWYLRDRVGPGRLFLVYLAGYFVLRVIVDFFRSEPVFAIFNEAQLAGIFMLIAVLLVIRFGRKLLRQQ